MTSGWRHRFLSVLLLLIILSVNPLRAEEPAADFLNALREANYFDTALLYLERMERDPLTPPGFRHEIQLERAMTLIRSARSMRDFAVRQQTLDKADAALRNFIRASTIHPRIYEAKSELGQLAVERAQLEIAFSKQSNKQTHIAQAQTLFTQSAQMFVALQKEIKAKLEQYPKVLDPVKQRREIQMRKKLRADYLQVQMMEAAVLEEHSNTHDAASPKYKELLTRAGDRFGLIYKNYRQRYAGLYCRIYQGRCFFKVKKFNDALSFFTDIFDLSDDEPEFIVMKREAMLLAFKCWLDPTMQKYAEAIDQSSKLLDAVNRIELRTPPWMEIQLMSARAHQGFATYLEKRNPKDKQIAVSRRQAKAIARKLSRLPGSHQREARKLLAELGGPDLTKKRPEPRNFEQAVEAGKDALNAYTTAGAVVADMTEAKIAAVKDAKVKAEMTKNLAAARKAATAGLSDAIEFLNLALEMADSDSPLDEVNIVRYFLCYLYWAKDEYHEAAAVGEFVSVRYPDSSGARQCAKIAMAAYLRLYDAKPETANRSFETTSVIRIANHITQTWPTSVESQEALNTLIRFMVNRNELAQAKAYLGKMPVNSRYRLLAELRTGRAMWREYLNLKVSVATKRKQNVAEADLQTEMKQMADLLKNAGDILIGAINRTAAKAPIDELYAVSSLSMARIHLEKGEPNKAIGALEHKRVGALPLLKKKHASTAAKGFSSTAYRAALKSYIQAMGKKGADTVTMLAKARLAMDGLKNSTTSGNKKDVVGVYVGLARDLQNQMASATPQVQNSLAQGFDAFLQEIQKQTEDKRTLNWVADTYRTIGEGIKSKQTNKADTSHFFTQAKGAYEKLLALAKQDTKFMTIAETRQVRGRLALAYRGLGDFKSCVDLLEKILGRNDKLLNIQVEAARTYQEWGASGDPRLYGRAIAGARRNAKTGKNTIWGWARLARLTAGKPKYKATFREARLNVSKCRYLEAMRTPNKKQAMLKRARRSLTATLRAYRDVGGPTWTRKYDQLMKQIQTGLGERPTGIADLLKTTKAAGG